ncbi:hypothetical protein [Oligoflexus tunisiensis]|uniref:hypothetical protein n=1 Tax=Oligoflexus tunisiensis TaxID=708132 RepID=UPI00114D33B7|nr:hypothetical protein [Oligoflexus tunisiensis]
MEFARFESPNIFHLPVTANPANDTKKSEARRSLMTPLVAFQLIVTIGLSVLASFLQFEFYREHDVLPGYAWPLAIAGSAGMLSLATVKFDGFWTDLPRKVLYCACYIFMVISSSFHVANDAWNRVAKLPNEALLTNSTLAPAQELGLQAVVDALKLATKNRAWNAMETLGAEVSKQAAAQPSISPAKPLGVSQDLMIWIGAAITLLLRALLEGIQAINAVALRKYFGSRLLTKA